MSEDLFMVKMIKWIIGVVVILVLIAFLNPFTTVDVGEKGIVISFGKIDRVLDPGIHWRTPFTESVVKMNVQTQKETSDAQAASSDLQTVKTTIAVNYNIDPAHVVDLYTTVGTNYVSVIIDPAVQKAVKATTAKYTAEQLITKRQEVSDAIQSALADDIATSFLKVTAISLTNFEFSPGFNQAIEAKVTAEQNALAAKNLLEQKKFEAEQTIVTAEATARSIRLQSDAANNEKYVALKKIEVQQAMAEKWDGKLPVNMYAGAPLPLLNVTQ